MQTNLILENLMAMAVYTIGFCLDSLSESESITGESPLLTDIQNLSLT